MVTDNFIYEVTNDFPRIVPGTMPGLVRASYTLELDSNFEDFLVEFDDVGEVLER